MYSLIYRSLVDKAYTMQSLSDSKKIDIEIVYHVSTSKTEKWIFFIEWYLVHISASMLHWGHIYCQQTYKNTCPLPSGLLVSVQMLDKGRGSLWIKRTDACKGFTNYINKFTDANYWVERHVMSCNATYSSSYTMKLKSLWNLEPGNLHKHLHIKWKGVDGFQ